MPAGTDLGALGRCEKKVASFTDLDHTRLFREWPIHALTKVVVK